MTAHKAYTPANKIDAATETAILTHSRAGTSNRQIARDLGIDESTVRRAKARVLKSPGTPSQLIYHDKKVGHFNWRDAIPAVEGIQKLREDATWSQQHATISIGDGSSIVSIMFLSDMHIGAAGTNYKLFVELTDMILNTPNLFVAVVGDVVEMAIKMRSVAEVCFQILDPSLQVAFMESWIEEIQHKVIFCTWGNHESDRNESAAGSCPIKNILARHAPYFSGIGHADLIVGDETYKLAVSHKFQGVTQLDVTAGCKKYLRMEYPEGEIAVQGDAHRFGISQYNEGGKYRIAMATGTLNVKSGFAQRYFSLKTSTAFPVIALWPKKHLAVPFRTVSEWLNSQGIEAPVHAGI